MSIDGYVVVLIGAGSEVGREVRGGTARARVSGREWRLYDDAPEDQVLDVDESGEEIFPLGEIDVEGADVVFLCGAAAVAAEWVAPAHRRPARLVIDLTQSARRDAPKRRSSCRRSIRRRSPRAWSAACWPVPIPSATALAVALKPLDAAAELQTRRGHLVRAGVQRRPGRDRRARPADARSARRGVDGQPRLSAAHRLQSDPPGRRLRLGRTHSRRVADRVADPPSARPARPADHGDQRAACRCSSARPARYTSRPSAPLDGAGGTRGAAPGAGLLLADEDGPDSYPTLADVIGSDATHVGRVRDDPTVPYGLTLWIAIDGLRKGAAVNAVQLAERALRERA